MPRYGTKRSAALDLVATEGASIPAGGRLVIPTDLSGEDLHLEDSQVALVCPRSGLAMDRGITVLNSPGIIDPDYKGNIGVVLYNAGNDVFDVQEGDRIAQLLILNDVIRLDQFVGNEVREVRGEEGFGSTGV